MKGRLDAKRLAQEADLRRRRMREQALDVLLERRNRRVPLLHLLDAHRRVRRHPRATRP